MQNELINAEFGFFKTLILFEMTIFLGLGFEDFFVVVVFVFFFLLHVVDLNNAVGCLN